VGKFKCRVDNKLYCQFIIVLMNLRIFIILLIAFLSYIIFGKLPYSINDDFLLNALYSGSFTEGNAYTDVLFQHRYFNFLMIWLNNNISNGVNWYFLIHFILLWTSIFGYLILARTRESSILKDSEFWVWLFIGVWFSYNITFTWISAILGIISWLTLMKDGEKFYIHWIFIGMVFFLSFLVRPQILILLTIIVNVHCVFLYYFRHSISINKLKLIFSISISILLVYKLMIPNNVENSPLKKFPYQWVTEQSFLKEEILAENQDSFSIVDYEVAHNFFYDDRFSKVPITKFNTQSGTLKHFIHRIGLINYLKKCSRIFFTKFIRVLSKSYLLIILLFFVLFLPRRVINDTLILFLIILVIECLVFMATNLRISKERVLIPPFILVVLYYLFNGDEKMYTFKKCSIISLISLISLILIFLFLSINYFKSQAFNLREKQFSSIFNKIENKICDQSNSQKKLFFDPSFVLWNEIWSNTSRAKVYNFRTNLLPPSWAMRSVACDKRLEYFGVSSIQNAINKNKIIFLIGNSDKNLVWVNYLNKYKTNNQIIDEALYFKCDSIVLKKLEIIDKKS